MPSFPLWSKAPDTPPTPSAFSLSCDQSAAWRIMRPYSPWRARLSNQWVFEFEPIEAGLQDPHRRLELMLSLSLSQ
jgi:hypothetical protein